MIVFQITEFLASFVEALLGISVNGKMLNEDALKIKDSIIASCIIALTVWVINQFWIFSIAATAVAMAGTVLGSCVIYKVRFFDSVAVTAAYVLLVYIVDFFSVSLLGVALGDTQFASTVTSELSSTRVFCLIVCKGLLCAVYFILDKNCLAKIQIPVRKVGVAMALIGVQIYVLIKSTYERIDSDTFFIWLFFFLLFISVVYFTTQILSYVQIHDRMVMAMERNDLLANNYKREIRQYQKERIFYHDLKNQLVILETYMRKKEYGKAEEYIKALSPAEAYTAKQRTGIDALDLLIGYKKREAEAHKIQMDITADAVKLKLTEQEVVALVGNLLDNAIEACNNMDGDVKWIRVAIRSVQEMTFIKTSNSYGKEPAFDNSRFLSTKKEKKMHGLGMASMKLIVEKYEGNMDVSYNDGCFTVMISLFN